MVDVQWGPEIPVDGKRPEWLRDEDEFQWADNHHLDFSWWRDDCTTGSSFNPTQWHTLTAIRLPTSHPHYAASQPLQASKGASGYDEGLIERMVALVRQYGTDDNSIQQRGDGEYRSPCAEARAIVAEMEPAVDGDLVEARDVAASVYDTAGNTLSAENIRLGLRDEGMDVCTALAAIRRGRELERNAGGK